MVVERHGSTVVVVVGVVAPACLGHGERSKEVRFAIKGLLRADVATYSVVTGSLIAVLRFE
jgi:hypothetical protein